MVNQSYSRAFVKDNFIVVIGQVLTNLKAIILLPILIRTVGVSVYGGFILLSSILGFVLGISSLGVGFKATRLLPSADNADSRSDLFYPQFYFQLCSILLLSIVVALFHNQINTHLFKNEISYSSLVVVFYLSIVCLVFTRLKLPAIYIKNYLYDTSQCLL